VDTGAGTVTVTPKHGSNNVVLNVDSTTQIHRNGTVATLADLHAGDRINAKYNPVTFLAAEIWAWPNYVSIWGTISGVDTGASTVTITPKNGGADVVLKVDSNTMIRRGHNQATLADLQVGDHVFGVYDQATLLATMLIVLY
jgi:Cu/Ag efflux protein CusF